MNKIIFSYVVNMDVVNSCCLGINMDSDKLTYRKYNTQHVGNKRYILYGPRSQLLPRSRYTSVDV